MSYILGIVLDWSVPAFANLGGAVVKGDTQHHRHNRRRSPGFSLLVLCRRLSKMSTHFEDRSWQVVRARISVVGNGETKGDEQHLSARFC